MTSPSRTPASCVRSTTQLLSPIQHPSAESQADLVFVRARDALVGARAKFTNTARGLIKTMGGRLPACSTTSFGRRVREHIPSELHAAMMPLVAMVDDLARTRQFAVDLRTVCASSAARAGQHPERKPGKPRENGARNFFRPPIR
jgi:hypothetical protein